MIPNDLLKKDMIDEARTRLVSYPDPYSTAADGLHHRYVESGAYQAGDEARTRLGTRLGLGRRL